MEELNFEVLALDTDNNSNIDSERNLIHSLLANGSLWHDSDPKMEDDGKRIVSENVTITAKSVDEESSGQAALSKAFLVLMTGSYSRLEPLRASFAKHLEERHFDHIYILIDEVSETIACKLYPKIYKVENLLRAYLIKFMSTRLGPNWWEITAANDLRRKVNQRKNNEKTFGPLIKNDAYLVDFKDVGRMIYSYSSGFTSKQDIISKIQNLEEKPEAVRELKKQMQSNYQKFFKESFKDNNFQEKWEELEKIRHKVAHNNLFTEKDLKRGNKLSEELISTIQKAIEAVEELVIPAEEKTAIKKQIVDKTNVDKISEEDFIEQLRASEEYFADKDGFVGMNHFIKTRLAEMGYEPEVSSTVASRLEDKGKVRIYKKDNPHGDYPTTVIETTDIEA